ncbi:hypothetical protein GmHk_05G012704 [Glycine max]|nr:hypothetical protein GmHk_05G012704 [Glycine max]
MRGERNRGWERVRLRGEAFERERARFRAGFQKTQTRTRDGQQQYYNLTNWRDRNEISSFYFTRFSDDITEKDLWCQFKKWGDVREVFISRQRNKNGRRYGFVRFKGVNDEHMLERQLDSIVIGRMKLYVNLPRFRRHKGGKITSDDKQHEQRNMNENEVSRHIQGGARTNQASYAEVVARKRHAVHSCERRLSSVHLEPSAEILKWLSDAWVGRLTNPATFDEVEDELRLDFGVDISTKYLGDDMVLLFGLNNATAGKLIQEDGHGTVPLFYSLQKWTPSLRPSYRLAWVQCWEISVIAWDVVSIKKIVGVMGELVEVDDDAEERRRMDRARVLVKTPWQPDIQHTVEVHIGAEVYKVCILEECGYNTDTWQRRRSSITLSSEEIDSDGSFMGSSASEKTHVTEFNGGTWVAETQPNTAGSRRTTTSSGGVGVEERSSPLSNGPPESQAPKGKGIDLQTKGAILDNNAEDELSDREEEGQCTDNKEETTDQVVEEGTRGGGNEKQEATMIWELAKQLGATGVEDQGRIAEKFMTMEDRDRKEAKKVGNRSHNS